MARWNGKAGFRIRACLLLTTAFLLGVQVAADWGDARCDIYPRGEDRASAVLACVFYQAQGHIVISRSDGKEYDLIPQEDDPDHYRDSTGADVYRELMGEQGMVFRLPEESLFVYWDTSGLPGRNSADELTRPFSTRTLDATAQLICTLPGVSESGRAHCPAGVVRGPGKGRAVVAILRPDGFVRLLQLEDGRVVAHGKGKLSVERFNDEWRVRIDNGEGYRIPVELLSGD